MLLDAADRDESTTAAEVWDAIENIVSRADLRAWVSHVRQVLPPVEVNPDGEWRATMIGRYASVRGFAPLLCQVIDFGATGEGEPLLAAMRALPALLDARPSTRVPAGWLDERRIVANVVPAGGSLLALRDRLEATLPKVDLLELVLEVMSWDPRLVEAFRSLSGGDTRLPDLEVSITAALTAHALNVGYGPVISDGTAALTRSSDLVWGLLRLLDFDYRPQLADLPDQKLWRKGRAEADSPVSSSFSPGGR